MIKLTLKTLVLVVVIATAAQYTGTYPALDVLREHGESLSKILRSDEQTLPAPGSTQPVPAKPRGPADADARQRDPTLGTPRVPAARPRTSGEVSAQSKWYDEALRSVLAERAELLERLTALERTLPKDRLDLYRREIVSEYDSRRSQLQRRRAEADAANGGPAQRPPGAETSAEAGLR